MGAIGMVIGHEITHGFDDQGRQYDGTGSASPWWSQETIEAFAVQAQCFIDQYCNYTVPELVDILGEEDAHLNGKNTQGENIADNGGIHESFRCSSSPTPRCGARSRHQSTCLARSLVIHTLLASSESLDLLATLKTSRESSAVQQTLP